MLGEHTEQTQFGFKNGLGIKEAILTIQVLIGRCRYVNADVFLYFIDIHNTFDLVRNDKMLNTLKLAT